MLAPVTTSEAAEQLALDFLLTDLGIPEEDRDWFAVLDTRTVQSYAYIVEIGVEGLPDKWVVQVYDTGECDPSYTFYSPIRASSGTNDIEEMPESIFRVIAAERTN